MNLLKLLTVVVFAASIFLLLPAAAQAVDHPWDDRPTDTTTVGWKPESGATDTPRPNTPVITRIFEWTRFFILEVKSVFIGGERNDTSVKPTTGSNKRIDSPVKNRKTK